MTAIRQKLGALVYDLPKLGRALLRRDGWVDLVNRNDHISVSSDPIGVLIDSGSTSSMHLCDVWPSTGRWLLRHAAREHRFVLADQIRFSEDPLFSFVIPHRGRERKHLLEATIRSIAACGGDVECLVVEQDEVSVLDELPGNTRHIHAPHPGGDSRWNKCYAFNRGVEQARGKIIICHDGDVIVPKTYLSVIQRHLVQDGVEVAFPQRFLFYLSERSTTDLLARWDDACLSRQIPVMVKQNWVGGTLAISKQSYWKIGGFDESFTGWTGEDREFYDRCRTLKGWFHGYVPFLHLWHPPQRGRVDADDRLAAYEFTQKKLAIEPNERIRMLCEGVRAS